MTAQTVDPGDLDRTLTGRNTVLRRIKGVHRTAFLDVSIPILSINLGSPRSPPPIASKSEMLLSSGDSAVRQGLMGRARNQSPPGRQRPKMADAERRRRSARAAVDEENAEILDQLRSRAEIAEVIMRYCRAFDRCDETLLRGCFHPDSTHEHGAFKGSSADFCAHGLELVRDLVLTHHQLGQISIEIDGETAYVESYFTSYHRFGASPPAGGQPHEDRILGGRYIDRFERRDGVWRIARRRGVSDWIRYEPASDRGFFDRPEEERGRRDRNDPVYRRD